MGAGVLDAGAAGHDLATEASDILDVDVVRLACEAGADEIRATEVAQPLLLLMSVALLRSLPDATSGEVAAVAGHSLGEYTALVASGALEWQDALRLVRTRGRAMAAASSPDQGMAAVLGLEEDVVAGAIAEAVTGVVVVANLNAPGQVVISGEQASIDWAAGRLKEAGAKRVIPLSVGGAFHSPLMRAASVELQAALADAPLRDASVPQAFNVDGRVRTGADEIREALAAQLTSAVRWTACVDTLLQLGVDRFCEVGAGGTLTAMGKRIAPDASWVTVNQPGVQVAR